PNKRPPRPVAPAGAAHHLRQQLKGPLRRAEVSEAQPDVRRHDAHERDARKIVALRDHLGADEDVYVACPETREDLRQRALAADRIAVEAGDARLRAQPPPFCPGALPARAPPPAIPTPAMRTRRPHPHPSAAVEGA